MPWWLDLVVGAQARGLGVRVMAEGCSSMSLCPDRRHVLCLHTSALPAQVSFVSILSMSLCPACTSMHGSVMMIRRISRTPCTRW